MSETLATPTLPSVVAPTQLAGYALVLNLLGKLLYEPPTPAGLQALTDAAVFDDIPFTAHQPAVAIGLTLLQHWLTANGDGRQAYPPVAADYARLFVGPGKIIAPPWESVQVDEERLTFQAETLQVRQWYRQFGLQAVQLYAEPDDHVGLELAFLSHLAQLALVAQAEGDHARLAQLLDAQRGFLKTHAQRWIPAWSAQVIHHARTDYYRGLAHITVGVLAELDAAL